ncbi:MAG: type II toxin-antitoxin system HicA family toxin [Pseudomonadota bacterium]
MVKGFYKDVTAILRKNGFELVRQGKGSHEIWRNDVLNRQTTVSRTILSRHMANKVFRQCGLKDRI